jgi:tetratricopeptide (TPR) repeat protein
MRWLIVILAITGSLSFVQAQSKQSKLKTTEALGDTLLTRQDFAGALKQYNKVAKATKLMDSEARQILYKRALCYFYLADYTKAIADLDVFIPENENLPRARILRAFIFREIGELDRQLDDLNEILDWDPLNVDLLKWRAGLMVELGKNEEAVGELKNIKKFGSDEEVELYLGLAYYALDYPDSAIAQFDEAILINGGYLPAYLYAGSLSLEQEAYELALTYINLGLMLERGNLQLTFYKGIAFVELDRKDEGCSLLNKAFYGGIDEAGDYLQQYCYPEE